MPDLKKRTFIKAVSWKVLGFFVLSLTAFIVTGSIEQTGFVAVIYHFLMLCLFIVHERVWNKVRWGKTRGLYIQLTGMSGAGKTTLAKAVEKKLVDKGINVEVIDGDEYRENLCSDLGFTRADREENIRRLSFVGKILGRNNVVCIMSAINPYNSTRSHVKKTIPDSKLVYIKCSLDELKRRDPKGLYRRASLPDGDSNKVYNFTGISDLFDEPENEDLIIETDKQTQEQSLKILENFIIKNIS